MTPQQAQARLAKTLTVQTMSPSQAQARLVKTLHRFQKIGANFLYGRRVALLADEMGLGKTIQALAAVRPDEGTLVVCPAFLMLNWKNEIERYRPDLEILFDVDLRQGFPRPGQIAITAYSRLPETEQQRLEPIAEACVAWGLAMRDLLSLGPAEKVRSPYVFHRWDGAETEGPVTLILDEGHYVKTSSSARTERVRALASECSRVWILTGTPMINRPPELWALLQAAQWSGKDVFGSWDEMVRLFSGRKLKYGGYDWHGPVLPGAMDRLRTVMLRRTRAEVAPEIPLKSYREIVVPIERSRVEQGEDFSFLDGWSDAKVEHEATKPAGALFSARRELAEAKLEALEDLLETYEDAGEPVVVFSCHKTVPEHLMFRRFWTSILGETPMDERQTRVEAFQAGKMRGLAGTVGAMGVGVTLTRAAHAVFVDRPWTPAEEDQAEDRLCRIGQTRPVLVTRLVADHPLERRVAKVLENKREMLRSAGL